MASISKPQLSRPAFAGLFLTAMSTLTFEILLTRIFSLTMWYHFAFVAVSIAMFGMSLGAVLVYLFPRLLNAERAPAVLAASALLFSVTILGSVFLHLGLRFDPLGGAPADLAGKAMTYLVVAVPFTMSGVAVSLALAKFPAQVSRLYAADLAGAATGCLLVIILLDSTGDALASLFVLAGLAALGAVGFAWGARRDLVVAGFALAIVFTGIGGWLAFRVSAGSPAIRITWVKGERQEPALIERWNSHARIRILGDPELATEPHGWGLSPVYKFDRKLRQLALLIDASAGTMLTNFEGDLARVDHLKFDITNLAHLIRTDADVAVMGAGGGRDVLSALAFGQRSVTAIEINGDILEAVNGTFGDFTGHLDRMPNVEFVHDEARSYLTRTDKRFDIIQASLIDTWAAVSAGAFVLSENAIYTTEAWRTFLDRLAPGGLLTFTRYYVSNEMPGEMYRLMSLADAALRDAGAENPADHVVIARYLWRTKGDPPHGIATVLVSRDPFTEQDLDVLERRCEELQFELVYTPRRSADPNYSKITSEGQRLDFMKSLPIDISAPTDNRPFFFHMLRARDLFGQKLEQEGYFHDINLRAVRVLGWLLVVVVVLAGAFIIVPLAMSRGLSALAGQPALLIFFTGIGLGFLLIEISMMQSVLVFLGHPTYSLSVVLFSMLLAGGAGSYLTRNTGPTSRGALLRLAALLGTLVVAGLATGPLLQEFRGAPTAMRVFVALALISAMGVWMGMAFPLGMKLASERAEALAPWLWSVNGAASVVASVGAAAIALWAGIAASFWAGVFCYMVAVAAYAQLIRRRAAP